MFILLACPSCNALSLLGTRLCPLGDGDEVFGGGGGGGGNCLRGSRFDTVAGREDMGHFLRFATVAVD